MNAIEHVHHHEGEQEASNSGLSSPFPVENAAQQNGRSATSKQEAEVDVVAEARAWWAKQARGRHDRVADEVREDEKRRELQKEDASKAGGGFHTDMRLVLESGMATAKAKYGDSSHRLE